MEHQMTPTAQARATVKDIIHNWFITTEANGDRGIIGFTEEEWTRLEISFAAALQATEARVWEEAAQECLQLKYYHAHNSVEGLHDFFAEKAHAARQGEETP